MLKNQFENLEPEMTLNEIQSYMKTMAEKRGFVQDPTVATMLILLEEVGELAKALRKYSGLKIDQDRIESYGNLSHEMADVLICLLMLANKCKINVFDALAEKEKVNKQRTWITQATQQK